MRDRISIEPLAEFSGMGIVNEILSQPSIAMVALGSMACVASLLHNAELLEAVNKTLRVKQRLIVQGLSAREYCMGKNSKIVVQLLQKAVELPNVRGIIVYCSCLDVLTGWDEQDILSKAAIPKGIKVAFLYRGPLVKRRLPPKMALKEIWNQWGYQPMPVLSLSQATMNETTNDNEVRVDFKTEILGHRAEEIIILLSPGGCASCLFDVPHISRNHIFYTRFDDLMLNHMKAETFVKAIEYAFSPQVGLLLLGTAVIKAVGIDLDEICLQLNKDGYRARYLSTDGFRK